MRNASKKLLAALVTVALMIMLPASLHAQEGVSTTTRLADPPAVGKGNGAGVLLHVRSGPDLWTGRSARGTARLDVSQDRCLHWR